MPYVNHLHYEERGQGRPVIFIHCPAVSRIYWQPVIDRLQSQFRCIAIDVRGHGKSGLGDTPWRFTDIAEDLAMLTRALDLERPVLVGYSTGGAIGLLAPLEHSGLFGGVVATGGYSECSNLYLKTKAGAGLWAARAGLSKLVARVIVRHNGLEKAHRQAMMPEALAVRPVSLQSIIAETLRVNFTRRLPKIDVPVLLVYGGKDDPMHRYCRILQRWLPEARSVFFPGADHRVPTQAPDDFADSVTEFIYGIDAPPKADELPVMEPSLYHPGIQTDQIHP